MRKFLLFIWMMIVTGAGHGFLYGACPANYTTATQNVGGVIYSVCYPSVVSLSVNGGQFNIYISINNTTASTTPVPTALRSFVPDSPMFTNINGSITSNPPNGNTQFNMTDTTFDNGGRGSFVYSSGIVSGDVATATVTVQANSVGSYSYNPVAQAGTATVFSTQVYIVVEASCPTITASNVTTPPICAGNMTGVTGTVGSSVTGGTPPYAFSVVAGPNGGTVNFSDNSGDFTFFPSINAGGTTGGFDYRASDVAGCLSNTASVFVPINANPFVPNPILFNNPNYTTPITGTASAGGGTPPYTFTVVPGSEFNINGPVVMDPVTGDYTFTQAAPGASSFQYIATDANGCTSVNAYVFAYSCATPGYVASANLVGLGLDTGFIIISICHPATVNVGDTFSMQACISNATSISRTVDGIRDPFPSGQPGYDPGLQFVNVTAQDPNVTVTTTGSNLSQGGMGLIFPVGSASIPAFTSWCVSFDTTATATGTQTYVADSPANPPSEITVVINVVNCPPIVAADETITSCTNSATGNLSGLVMGGSGPYTFNVVTPATCGQATVNPSGIFTFTGVTGQTGPCSFGYAATDVNGCTSSIGTVTTSFNNGPSASNTAITGCSQAVSGDLNSLVAGGAPPLTFSLSGASCGTVVINPNGIFNYTAPSGVTGTCSFTYDVVDSAQCSSNGTVSITNTGLVAIAQSATTCGRNSVTFSLLAGNTACVPPLNINFVTGAVYGTVIINPDGTITYLPTTVSSTTLIDTFEYGLIDGAGNTASSTVTVTIFPAPTANNTAIASSGPFVTGNVSSLVTGGLPPYTFSQNGPSSCDAQVSVAANGAFSFTAPLGFSGPCSFGYGVVDAEDCSATGTVTITVGTGSGPICVSGPRASNTTIRVTGNSATGNLAPLVTGGLPPYIFSQTGPISCDASVSVTPQGLFAFTGPTGFSGVCSFGYGVVDAAFCPATGIVTINNGTGPFCGASGPTGPFFPGFVEKFS